LLHFITFGLFSFGLKSYVSLSFITLRYVHGTPRHILVFPLFTETPHLLSIVLINLHISPSPLLIPSIESLPITSSLVVFALTRIKCFELCATNG